MGCGQSQFSLIHPKKHKRKARRNKDNSDDESDEDEEDKFRRNGRLVSNKSTSNLVAAVQNEEHLADTSKLTSYEQFHSTSLHAHREMSLSQYDFFRTLDEKIQNGPDYDEFSESERQLENARTRQLLMEWERAKQKRRMLNEAMTSGAVPQPSARSATTSTARNAASQVCPRLAGLQTQFLSSSSLFYNKQPQLNGQLNGPYQMYRLQPAWDRLHQYHQQGAQDNQSGHGHGQSLSNSIVMYDEARGQFYTELA